MQRLSDVLIVSRNCAQGATVVVAAPPRIATVAIATACSGRGLTALMLGRVHGGPTASGSVTVQAFRDGHRVAQIRFTL